VLISGSLTKLSDEKTRKTISTIASSQRLRQHITEMTKFPNDQPGDLQEYDEQLVRSLIDEITVINDKLTIEFKSCVEIDIEI